MKEIVYQKKLVDLDNFERKAVYNSFMNFENPRYTVVCKVDISPLYFYSKKNKHLNARMIYAITKACNSVQNFKFRIEDGKLYEYDKIHSAVIFLSKNNQIRQAYISIDQDVSSFIDDYEYLKNTVAAKGWSQQIMDCDCFADTSCVKWFQFSGVQETLKSKNDATTCFIWDKVEVTEHTVTVNLAITVNHALVDGYHIAQFLESLNAEIEKYKI